MTDRSPCPEPVPLRPHPSVALVAYRYESVSEPGTFHDAALMVPDPEAMGARPWWQCDCKGFVAHDHCWHVSDARRRWSEQQRINARRAT